MKRNFDFHKYSENIVNLLHSQVMTMFYLTKALSCIFTHAPGNTKGGSITVPLTSCLTGLDESVLQIITNIVSCHTTDSKPVKQEVNGTVIVPSLVFPACSLCSTTSKETEKILIRTFIFNFQVCFTKL